MLTSFPVWGTFTVGRNTATAGTVFFSLIPPYPGPAGFAPFLYKAPANQTPNWLGERGAITHVTSLKYTTGTTLHQIGILRPKNFTTVASAAAINQAVINLTADPGIYSTNYKYPTPGSVVNAQVADHGIAAGDYAAYQLADGTWIADTVASVATLAITMTTTIPNITGGGVLAGAPFFYFGVAATGKDPATGLIDPQFDTTASTTNENFQDYETGICQGAHKGDPLIFYSPNPTAAGKLTLISGFYSPN